MEVVMGSSVIFLSDIICLLRRHCEERSNLRTVQIREEEFVKGRPVKKIMLLECPK